MDEMIQVIKDTIQKIDKLDLQLDHTSFTGNGCDGFQIWLEKIDTRPSFYMNFIIDSEAIHKLAVEKLETELQDII